MIRFPHPSMYPPGKLLVDSIDKCKMCGGQVRKKKVATAITPQGAWVVLCLKCDRLPA